MIVELSGLVVGSGASKPSGTTSCLPSGSRELMFERMGSRRSMSQSTEKGGLPPDQSRARVLSNLLQMLRPRIPSPFGVAIGLAVLSVRDDVGSINNDGFLFLTRE
jgi:hypothetical protein